MPGCRWSTARRRCRGRRIDRAQRAVAKSGRSRALAHFDAIRRAGSIRAAARGLHISSSALNRQLLLLEESLGFPLFERLPRGLRLTPGGEIVARHAITVLQDEARMAAELDALKGIRRGSVDVATVETLAAGMIPAVLDRLLARHPAVQVTVRIAGSAAAAGAVVDGDADIAIAFLRRRTDGLRQVARGRFRVGAVVPPRHPLAARGSVTFAECARHPLVLPTAELSIHDDLQPLFGSQARALQVVLATGSIELAKSLAARGAGIAFANRFGIAAEAAQAQLRFVPLRPAVHSELGIYVRAERHLPPAVDALVRIAADEIARLETRDGSG
ncbi:MAG: LysR family transcriptional regulator [Burkholderiales bacterium]|nr:LysR family transcriptional regulator [Burkholderiales bacterium]